MSEAQRKSVALVRVENHSACTHYRINLPFRYCRDELAAEGVDLVIPEPFHDTDRYDAAVFYRCLDAKGMTLPFKRALEGRLVYWDTDDHYNAIPDWSHAAKEFDSLDRLGWMEGTGMARRVAVTTPTLAAALPHRNGRPTDVLPNLIDLDEPGLATAVRPSYRGRKRLLWTGSATHEEDLRSVLPALVACREHFGDELDVILYGYCPEWLGEHPVVRPTHVGFSPLRHYPRILREIAADVAICPLATDPKSIVFNRCKSAIKWMECTVYGRAVVVAEDLETYDAIDHYETGFRCSGELDWAETLINVLSMTEGQQARIWKNAFDAVRERHSWQSPERRELWLDWYRKVAAGE